MNTLNICLIVLAFLLIVFKRVRENFQFYCSSPSTRNMSYDLRGDPVVIKRRMFPFQNSSVDPNEPPRCLAELR